MKTTNWQTKALTFFIAAVALWLAAACGEPASIDDEILTYERVMPKEKCPNDANDLNESVEWKMERADEIIRRNDGWLHAQKEVSHVDFGVMAVEPDQQLRTLGFLGQYNFRHLGRFNRSRIWHVVVIEVSFAEDYVDQTTLPPEERIPHCLEGFPVHFLTNQGRGSLETFSDGS